MATEPWITTTERIPYLVFPVGLPAGLSGNDLIDCLQSKVTHFSDVYNARAFSLSDDHSVIVCVRRTALDSECAIIAFLKESLPLPSEAVSDPICAVAYRGLATLNELLDRESGKEALTLLRIDPPEVSRKAPN